MKPNITVIGSSNTDMVIRMERIPRPGETIMGGHFLKTSGGKGANQAVAAARAGGKVTFIARVGVDTFGDEAVKGLEREGINVGAVYRERKAPSGVALIFVGANGENSIAVASGANARLSPADVRKTCDAITSSRVLLMQLESPLPTVLSSAKIARKAGVAMILNPAPARILPRDLLERTSILTPNQSETELLTGVKVKDERSALEAAKRLHGWKVETVIITMGAAGAFVSSPGYVGLIRGLKVKPVDTTAAGDVFNGTLAVALGEGMSVPKAVQFANAAAGISVTRVGAQASAPWRREIESTIRRGGFTKRC